MNQSELINELAASLAKAQEELTGASKDRSNPFFNSSYATLASVWDAWRVSGPKHGLSVVQTVEISPEGKLVLLTTLLHASGQWIRSYYPITPIKQDPQGFGSAMTYARRYSLAAIVGIAPEDDDGNDASDKKKPEPAKAEPVKKGDSAAKMTKAMEAPPSAAGTTDPAEDLYKLADILGGMTNKSAQEIVVEFSFFEGKAIKSLEDARGYLKRKPDGKWVSNTLRQIEDAIRERTKPTQAEMPEWASSIEPDSPVGY